jgi:hypothetical protein
VKVVAATFDEMNQKNVRFGFKPDRVWTFGEDEADCQGWTGLGVKQLLRLTQSPKCMDDVMFDPGQHLKQAADISPKAKDFFTAMLLADAMHISPLVARVAIDAKKGVAFAASSPKHKNAAGVKLPDCYNVKVPRVDVRKNGIAFTYEPKSLPFPVTPEYDEVETFPCSCECDTISHVCDALADHCLVSLGDCIVIIKVCECRITGSFINAGVLISIEVPCRLAYLEACDCSVSVERLSVDSVKSLMDVSNLILDCRDVTTHAIREVTDMILPS